MFDTNEIDINLKVSAKSSVSKVAGSLAANMREQKNVILSAMGQNAVYIAVRAISLANLFVNRDEKPFSLIFSISQKVADIDGDQKTVMIFSVFVSKN